MSNRRHYGEGKRLNWGCQYIRIRYFHSHWLLYRHWFWY